MVPLTVQAHDLVRRFARPGDIAIDATAGNGHDTLFLAETVGTEGRVLAIDLQSAACQACGDRVTAAGWFNVVVKCADHARLEELLPAADHGRVAVVMFNLGYLPGSNKSVITTPDSTLLALAAAWRVLRCGGLLCVVAYREHSGGMNEFQAVSQWMGERAQIAGIRQENDAAIAVRGPVLLALSKHSESGL